MPRFLHFHSGLVLIFYILFQNWDSFKTRHLLCSSPLSTTFRGLRNACSIIAGSPREPGTQSDRLKLDSCPQPSKRQNLGQNPRKFTDFASCSRFIGSAPGYKIKQWQKFQGSENILSNGMTENRCVELGFLRCLVKELKILTRDGSGKDEWKK